MRTVKPINCIKIIESCEDKIIIYKILLWWRQPTQQNIGGTDPRGSCTGSWVALWDRGNRLGRKPWPNLLLVLSKLDQSQPNCQYFALLCAVQIHLQRVSSTLQVFLTFYGLSSLKWATVGESWGVWLQKSKSLSFLWWLVGQNEERRHFYLAYSTPSWRTQA